MRRSRSGHTDAVQRKFRPSGGLRITIRPRRLLVTVSFDTWWPIGRPRPVTGVIPPKTNLRRLVVTAPDCSRPGDGGRVRRRGVKGRHRWWMTSRTMRWRWMWVAATVAVAEAAAVVVVVGKQPRPTRTSGTALAGATRTWTTGVAVVAAPDTGMRPPLQPPRPLRRNVTATVESGCRTL